MLYIFLEDPGKMVAFEMTLALESVATLKKAIEERFHIPASEQILLISGGEKLEDDQRVGKYHTGTDNNPIFLFRDVTNSSTPDCFQVDIENYLPDLSSNINDVLDLPPNIQTVISRSQLAQKFHKTAEEQVRFCEELVHDQHLQQQGWAAVLAHLDDMIDYYTNVCNCCERSYKQFLEIKDTFVELLNSFNDDLNRISKIPVLPALLRNEDSSTDEVESMSLLDWITLYKDGNNDQTPAEIATFCGRSIQVLELRLMKKVNELREYIKIAETNYRDVKVIETKLEHLEEVMRCSKRIRNDQKTQAQTFISNKTSAIKERDVSILKELCTFHREWLLVMESNHNELCKNLQKCVSYKNDLCAYLQTRLQWVRKMSSDMHDTNVHVFMYYESIKKLRSYYDLLQSLRSTPQMYITAVVEVVRRRTFSQSFLMWANDFSCQLLSLHSEEVGKRKKFHEQFEGHFLDKLFPGLDEFPPAYATQAPEMFDTMLPKLNLEDIETLKQSLPELDINITIPDISNFSHIFLLKSVNDTLTLNQSTILPPQSTVEDRIVQVVNAAGLASNLDPTLLKAADFLPNALCDDSHNKTPDDDHNKTTCESETSDTEEFEKLRNSGHTVSECSESNETIQTNIRQIGQDTNVVISELRNQLEELKLEVINNRDSIGEDFKKSIQECRRVLKERERTIIHLIQILGMKESELCTLRSQVINVESNLKSSIEREENERAKREELERKFEEEKQREIKEITESLKINHKTEMDNLRSRYKLMASNNMERSPSDTSLEKIETSHEAIILQLRENFESEKEKLLAEERAKWSEKLEHDMKQYKIKTEAEKQVWYNESMRKTISDHTNQVENFRKKEESLQLEIQKLETLSRNPLPSTSTTTSSQHGVIVHSTDELIRRVERLEVEKCELESRLKAGPSSEILESRLIPGPSSENLSSSSVSVYDPAIIGSHSDGCSGFSHSIPSPFSKQIQLSRELLPASTGPIIKISTSTCRTGDIVFILWNESKEFFHVFTTSDQLYLIHADEVPNTINESFLKKYGFIAEITSSEYCRAKKKKNRYNVPVDSKFYRVEIRPIHKGVLLRHKITNESS